MPPEKKEHHIGRIIAIALPILMATVAKDGYSTQLSILIAYIIIQFIDNNFLIPKMVSSKVQINALVSILIVLLGGALWGVPGMFLSFPLLPYLKLFVIGWKNETAWKIIGRRNTNKTQRIIVGTKEGKSFAF